MLLGGRESGVAFRQFIRDNFRPEVASIVISRPFVDMPGMHAHVKFGDSRSNGLPICCSNIVVIYCIIVICLSISKDTWKTDLHQFYKFYNKD